MGLGLQVFVKLDGGEVPEYQKEGDSGFDLSAIEDADIPAGGVKLIPTGLRFGIPKGYEIQVRSRSGLAVKKQVFVLNSPGTVDSGYTGDVGVILANFGVNPFRVQKGDRIAQGVLCPVEKAEFVVVNELTTTSRGSGGFGSTGV